MSKSLFIKKSSLYILKHSPRHNNNNFYALKPQVAKNALTPYWKFCAMEGNLCNCIGKVRFQYEKGGGTVYYRDSNSSVMCKYEIFGAYVTANTDLSDNLKMTLAGRYDTFNYMDASGFSPRATLVWSPNPRHTFRASYNVGSFTPSALQMYIDFPLVNVAGPVPGVFEGLDIWLQGQTEDRPVNNAMMTPLGELPINTPGLPLAAIWQFPTAGTTLGAATQFGLFQTLAASPIGPILQAPLTTFFSSVFDPTFGGGTSGSLFPYNLALSLIHI